jgi:hypothetical protein
MYKYQFFLNYFRYKTDITGNFRIEIYRVVGDTKGFKTIWQTLISRAICTSETTVKDSTYSYPV